MNLYLVGSVFGETNVLRWSGMAPRLKRRNFMLKNISYGKCLSFLKSQPRLVAQRGAVQDSIRPAITISRMTGAGGHRVAARLAEYLQTHVPGHRAWTVFDRNLIDKVLEDHHLDKRFADFVTESHKSMLADSVEEWMGLHPSSWTLVQQTNAAILQLAKMGNVILVGRGGNVITSKLPSVFHVRLVGSLDKRIGRAQEDYNLSRKAAPAFIKKEDNGRRRYLKENFDKDIDDPLLYHLIINTDLISCDDTACLIGDEMIRRSKLDNQLKSGGT